MIRPADRHHVSLEWHLLKVDTLYGVAYKQVAQCIVAFVVRPSGLFRGMCQSGLK